MKNTYYKLAQISLSLTLSTRELRKMIESGDFPSPDFIPLPRKQLWEKMTVQQWCESKAIPFIEPEIARFTKNHPLMTTKEVMELTTISKTHLLSKENEGKCPAYIEISHKKIRFIRTDVEQWVEDHKRKIDE